MPNSIQEIRYIIVEDDENFRRKLIDVFQPLGWILVTQLTSKSEALNYLSSDQFPTVQVAFVDGNLSPESQGEYDGYGVISNYKKQNPTLICVGISSEFNKPYGIDGYLGKNDVENQAQRIDQLVRQRLRT